MPEQLSAHAVLHGIAFGSSVILWVMLLFVLGSAFAEWKDRSWARACRVVAVGLLLVPPLSAGPNGAVAIYGGVSLGYLFFAAALLHLRSSHPHAEVSTTSEQQSGAYEDEA